MTTFRIKGVSWLRIGRGHFLANHFREGLELHVAGQRGRWQWTIDRRSPPTFSPACTVRHGSSTTKVGAMSDAISMLGIVERKMGMRGWTKLDSAA